MCLTPRTRFPRITLFPKKVYKVMYLDGEHVISPYQYKEYNLNHKYTAKYIFCESTKDYIHCIINDIPFDIRSGFFHSCNSIFSAVRLKLHILEQNIRLIKYPVVIVECIIPPFTFYYEDLMNSNIASRKIKFVKILNNETI